MESVTVHLENGSELQFSGEEVQIDLIGDMIIEITVLNNRINTQVVAFNCSSWTWYKWSRLPGLQKEIIK